MWQCHSTNCARCARGRRKLGLSYKDAGVDIAAGNALVETIKPLAAATQRAGSMDGIGGFGALFDPRAAGFEDPILVAATDGVGTKLKLAFATGQFDTLGIDLVAMCVNDLVVQGAEPLFFLDYFATGGLDEDVAAAVVSGIAEGCKQAGCALVGGETAEMPGLYGRGEFDLAGFSVGAMERGEGYPRTDRPIEAGDAVIGLTSNGVHSNGYSLVRKIVERAGCSLSEPAPFDRSTGLGAALLEPTRIYVRACLDATQTVAPKGFAHITGGGLLENIPRVVPKGLGATLDGTRWAAPPVFNWLRHAGGVEDMEMARTFNCGIGMVVIAGAEDAGALVEALNKSGEDARIIGEITASSDGEIELNDLDAALGGAA